LQKTTRNILNNFLSQMPKKYVRIRRNYNKTSKRPLEKILISLNFNQSNQKNLFPAGPVNTGIGYPGTITGLQWDIVSGGNTGSLIDSVDYFAIVKAREGQSIGIVALPSANANLANFYNPEQDVMATGICRYTTSQPSPYPMSGKTKSMRKLQKGDSIQMSYVTNNANGDMSAQGIICMFYKT